MYLYQRWYINTKTDLFHIIKTLHPYNTAFQIFDFHIAIICPKYKEMRLSVNNDHRQRTASWGVAFHPSMMTSSNRNIFRDTGPLCVHRSPVNSPHRGQWRGALMFSLICAWINDWVNNREAGDLRRHHSNYDSIATQHYFSELLGLYHTWVRYPGFSGHEIQCPIQTTAVPGFSGDRIWCTTWS